MNEVSRERDEIWWRGHQIQTNPKDTIPGK